MKSKSFVRFRPFILYLFSLMVTSSQAVLADNSDSPKPSDALEDVKAVVNELSTVTSGVGDTIANLNKLSTSGAILLKTAFPIGSLFLAGLSIAGDSQSAEYKALTDLKHSMQKEFKKLSAMTNYNFQDLKEFHKLQEYSRVVYLPLVHNRILIESFMDPTQNKTDVDVDWFTHECLKSEFSPLKQLIYIERETVMTCSNSSEDHTEIFARLTRLLRKIVHKMVGKKKDDTLFSVHRSAMFSSLSKATEEQMEFVFEEIERKILRKADCMFDDVGEALSAAQNIVHQHIPRFTPCLLDYILMNTGYRRDPLLQMTNIIRGSLIEILFVAGACANISFHGNANRMDFYRRTIIERFDSIMKNMTPWVIRKLESFWPNVLMESIRNNVTHFESSSQIVDSLIAQYGAPNIKHNYEFAVTLGPQNQELDYFIICPSPSCFHLELREDVVDQMNIAVTRSPEDEFDRGYEALNYIRPFKHLFKEYVEKTLYNTKYVKTIKEKLESDTHMNVTSPRAYQTFLITRQYTTEYDACDQKASLITITSYIINVGARLVKARMSGSFLYYCEDYAFIFLL